MLKINFEKDQTVILSGPSNKVCSGCYEFLYLITDLNTNYQSMKCLNDKCSTANGMKQQIPIFDVFHMEH
jgi:hypothetical protein